MNIDICVDVESDGPYPPDYSMICFGAVLVSDNSKTFYRKVRPISDLWIPEALNVSGFTREQHQQFDDPKIVMFDFCKWIKEIGEDYRPTFWSDNLAYDWQWINYYCHKYNGSNPFGFSGRRIGDLYCGAVKDLGANRDWKHKFRKTSHDHNPINDALGNAEALSSIIKMIKSDRRKA